MMDMDRDRQFDRAVRRIRDQGQCLNPDCRAPVSHPGYCLRCIDQQRTALNVAHHKLAGKESQ